MTACMQSMSGAWIYAHVCVKWDFPYGCCIDAVSRTGNYQLSKQTDGIKESDWQFYQCLFWSKERMELARERKIAWHCVLAPPLDIFIFHSPVTSIRCYSFTLLTRYILASGLPASTFYLSFLSLSLRPFPLSVSFLLLFPLSPKRRSSRVDALLRWLT